MRRLSRRPGLWLAALLCVGCAPADEIRTYSVAKPPAPEGYRILGGAFPADEPRWFFKLTGREKALAVLKAEFEAYLTSVQLPPDGGPPTWTLPAGWRAVPVPPARQQFVSAIVQIGPEGEKPLEVTVSPAMGGAEANVKRWAGQVGAPADDIRGYTKPLAGGLLVDVAGPKNPGAGAPMMMGR